MTIQYIVEQFQNMYKI